MPNIGPMELILLGVVAVLLFGPAKIPEMARSLGRATREFKDSVTGTGIGEALDGVNDVRTTVTPSNLAKAAMPAPVKEMAAGVTEMKETFTDPLGQKKEKEQAEAEAADDAPVGRGRTAARPRARCRSWRPRCRPHRPRPRPPPRLRPEAFLSSALTFVCVTSGRHESPPTEDRTARACRRRRARRRDHRRRYGTRLRDGNAAHERQGRAQRDGGQLELVRLRRHGPRLDRDDREPDDAVQERHRDLEAADADLPRDEHDLRLGAIWVGLGGYSTKSTALEQTGTSADCVQRARRPTTPGTSSSRTRRSRSRT